MTYPKNKRTLLRAAAALLGAAVWISLSWICSPAASSLQSTKNPGETVERLFQIIGKGETEGAEALFRFPDGSSGFDVAGFREGLAKAAQELKTRGGITSFTILSQDVAGDHVNVRFEYKLGNGATEKDQIETVYDGAQWKIVVSAGARAEASNEVAAISAVKEITNAQILYSVTKGQGKYADLATLGRGGLIDPTLASGEKQGYLFTSVPINVKNRPAMFDTTAKPKPGSAGGHSFYCNETAVIYQAEGGEPPRATVADRVPRNGTPIE